MGRPGYRGFSLLNARQYSVYRTTFPKYIECRNCLEVDEGHTNLPTSWRMVVHAFIILPLVMLRIATIMVMEMHNVRETAILSSESRSTRTLLWVNSSNLANSCVSTASIPAAMIAREGPKGKVVLVVASRCEWTVRAAKSYNSSTSLH